MKDWHSYWYSSSHSDRTAYQTSTCYQLKSIDTTVKTTPRWFNLYMWVWTYHVLSCTNFPYRWYAVPYVTKTADLIDCWHFLLASFDLLLTAVVNVNATVSSWYLTKRGHQQNVDATESRYLTKSGHQCFDLLLAAVANVDAMGPRYLTKRGRQCCCCCQGWHDWVAILNNERVLSVTADNVNTITADNVNDGTGETGLRPLIMTSKHIQAHRTTNNQRIGVSILNKERASKISYCTHIDQWIRW